MPKRDDHFALWIICGVLSISVRELYSFTAKSLGLQKHLIWNIAAGLFVPKALIHTFWAILIGISADLIVGGIIGFLYGLFIEWRGNRHYILKAIGFGIGTWLFIFGAVSHILPPLAKVMPQDALSDFSSLIGHIIYGLCLGLAYKYLFRVEKPSSW
jgi:LacY proton/sugar symporter.